MSNYCRKIQLYEYVALYLDTLYTVQTWLISDIVFANHGYAFILVVYKELWWLRVEKYMFRIELELLCLFCDNKSTSRSERERYCMWYFLFLMDYYYCLLCIINALVCDFIWVCAAWYSYYCPDFLIHSLIVLHYIGSLLRSFVHVKK